MATLDKDILQIDLAECHITCTYNGQTVFDEVRFIRKPKLEEAEKIVRQWLGVPKLSRRHVVQCELVNKWRCSVFTRALYDNSFSRKKM